MLSLRHVTRTFTGLAGPLTILRDASLAVASGQFVAVQGPSGSGKTTMLLIGGGLLRPTSGEVAVDGENPYVLSAEARSRFRASRVGLVFQQFHLLPYFSVLDNVLTPALAEPRAGLRRRACDLIERFGLAARIDHVPAALSTGERQRTALARALLLEPKLLLADEPTGNLDMHSGAVVLRALRQFTTDGGAVLLVTHDLRAAAAADRRITLRDGRIVD